MKVAIQGERGSFSHEAAEQMLPGCTVVPCARSAEVFQRVQRGSVAAAVIPIENSLAGTVAEHADLLLAHEVFIEAEFLLRIVHNLIAAPGVKLSAVREVLSHPVALDQCRDFFRHHPRIDPVPFYDTAGSVKHVVAQSFPDAAAHRRPPRRPRILRQDSPGRHRRRQTQLHPLFPDSQSKRKFANRNAKGKCSLRCPLPAPDPTRSQQDFHRLQGEERSRSALQIAERLRPARHQPQQNRIPPPARTPLGIHLLRRFPSRRRRTRPQRPTPLSRSSRVRQSPGNLPRCINRAAWDNLVCAGG